MRKRLTKRNLAGIVSVAVMATTMAIVACGGEEVVEEQVETVAWGYSGAGAPANWASISADNATCGTGSMQSPIDITGYERGNSPPLSFSYRRDAKEVTNDGRLVAAVYEDGNRLGFGERTYQLENVVVRTPSEHHVDGQSYPLELQLEHSQVFGDIAIVSMLFEIGDEDPIVQQIIDNAPNEGGTTAVSALLNAADLQKKDLGYYSYKGSLTYPPCTEPVDWFVMLEIGTVSQAQVDAIKGLVGDNNRPLQPAGGREIATSGSRGGLF